MNIGTSIFLIFLLIVGAIAGCSFLTSEYHQETVELAQAQADNQNLRIQAANLETSLQETEQQKAQLTEALEMAVGERDAALGDLQSAQENIQILSTALDAERTAKDQAIAQLIVTKEQIASLQEQVLALQRDLDIANTASDTNSLDTQGSTAKQTSFVTTSPSFMSMGTPVKYPLGKDLYASIYAAVGLMIFGSVSYASYRTLRRLSLKARPLSRKLYHQHCSDVVWVCMTRKQVQQYARQQRRTQSK